jgi:polyisoprenyl-teichoic acid--peptidoglycan teichoic acid transferase
MNSGERMVVSRPLRRRRSRWLRRILFTGVVGVAFFLGLAIGIFYFSSSTVRETVNAAVKGGIAPEKAFPGREEVNLLLLGRDVDIDNRGRVMDTRGRTDTIILIHINFRQQTINLLSIPRDTLVRIPGYRGKHKINAAHAFGGPDLTAATVENLLSVSAEEYMVVNYEGFITAIDKLGGVTVDVDKELKYDDNWGGLHIDLQPGVQTLDGYQAMGYVRYRRSNDGRSDTDAERMARQQQFLSALRNQMTSPSNFLKMPKVIDSVRENIDGTLSTEQMMSLAYFLKRLPPERIRMEILPADQGRSYATARESEMRDLVQELFY